MLEEEIIKKDKDREMIPLVIPSDFNKIYATGAFGGYSPNDFRVLLFVEEANPQDEIIDPNQLKVVRVVNNELILSPLTAKQLAKWLMKQVEEFEKEFGKIPEPQPESEAKPEIQNIKNE